MICFSPQKSSFSSFFMQLQNPGKSMRSGSWFRDGAARPLPLATEPFFSMRAAVATMTSLSRVVSLFVIESCSARKNSRNSETPRVAVSVPCSFWAYSLKIAFRLSTSRSKYAVSSMIAICWRRSWDSQCESISRKSASIWSPVNHPVSSASIFCISRRIHLWFSPVSTPKSFSTLNSEEVLMAISWSFLMRSRAMARDLLISTLSKSGSSSSSSSSLAFVFFRISATSDAGIAPRSFMVLCTRSAKVLGYPRHTCTSCMFLQNKFT
mmetsp:Transcript_3780/g.9205  ORF Transcript_3780/g.9205 Transcript_3780/m.9205 type:complete len:267 (-) Transcript_3780:465-1265(-)